MFEQQPEPERWLPLRDACRLLHVNEATLRQWADNGYLRVYRTPGGHRRFWSGDVLSLTDDGAPAGIRGTDNGLEGSALRRIRRRLHGDTVARQPWYQSVEEEGRDRMRLFGRRLLSLLVQESPLRRQRQEALAESHILGKEYGSEMAERGVTLTNSLEAFVFFRSMVLESMEPKAWVRVLELADRVMVGLAESYQKHSS